MFSAVLLALFTHGGVHSRRGVNAMFNRVQKQVLSYKITQETVS